MRNSTFGLRAAVAAAALAAASFTASAGTSFTASLDFDGAVSGSPANTVLGSLSSVMRFANPDIEMDVDAWGSYTGTFHWVDATTTYGDVLVKESAAAVSGRNVLWNDGQPILILFSTPTDIASFSIRQDLSGYGNLTLNGSHVAFLDATGHEIPLAYTPYTQGGNPGLLLEPWVGRVNGVSGILLPGGVAYDNLSVAAVPEPETWATLMAGLGVIGGLRRRRKA